VITSSSGLENYPDQGDTFEWEQKATNVGGGSNNEMRTSALFNVEDANNTWAIRTNHEHQAVHFIESVGGTTNVIESDPLPAVWILSESAIVTVWALSS
jgi:hypothetical protein